MNIQTSMFQYDGRHDGVYRWHVQNGVLPQLRLVSGDNKCIVLLLHPTQSPPNFPGTPSKLVSVLDFDGHLSWIVNYCVKSSGKDGRKNAVAELADYVQRLTGQNFTGSLTATKKLLGLYRFIREDIGQNPRHANLWRLVKRMAQTTKTQVADIRDKLFAVAFPQLAQKLDGATRGKINFVAVWETESTRLAMPRVKTTDKKFLARKLGELMADAEPNKVYTWPVEEYLTAGWNDADTKLMEGIRTETQEVEHQIEQAMRRDELELRVRELVAKEAQGQMKKAGGKKPGPGRNKLYATTDMKRAQDMRDRGQPVPEIARAMNRKPREIEKMLDAYRHRKRRLENRQ